MLVGAGAEPRRLHADPLRHREQAAAAPACSRRRPPFYHQRSELEYTFFQTDFQNFCNIFFDNFCNFSLIFTKYHHFDINPIKITEIPKKFRKKSVKFWQRFAKSAVSLEIQRKLRQILWKMVQRSWKIRKIWNGAKETMRARKTLKNATLDAKIGVDTAENEPQKVSEKRIL